MQRYSANYLKLFTPKIPGSNRDPKTPIPPRKADHTRPWDNVVSPCDNNWAPARKHPDACRKSIHSVPDRNSLTPPSIAIIWSLGFSLTSLYTSRVERHPHSMSPDRSIYRPSFFSTLFFLVEHIWKWRIYLLHKKNFKQLLKDAHRGISILSPSLFLLINRQIINRTSVNK